MSLNAFDVDGFFLSNFNKSFVPCSETIHSFLLGVFFFNVLFLSFLYTHTKLYTNKHAEVKIEIKD